MEDTRRATARRIAHNHLARGDVLGWFEELYTQAGGDPSAVPWADSKPNPHLVSWLLANQVKGQGKSALVVGCGLGDDAEELARYGFDTTAFDISPTAIAWCHKRFPLSNVEYRVVDLFAAPNEWKDRFDSVLESYTLQVLPAALRDKAMKSIGGFVRPGGTLLLIARGRDPGEDIGSMPWPLTRAELSTFITCGFREISIEDYHDPDQMGVRRFR
jgi:SAM-dependent methyltransferase